MAPTPTVILNRKRAYLDDPLWLLNEACKINTGQDLPSGFYTCDWKKEGKVWKRTITGSLLSNPLQTNHYLGLDTKILKVNLTAELDGIFNTPYHNYTHLHLTYIYVEAFVRVLEQHGSDGGDFRCHPALLEKYPRPTDTHKLVPWWRHNQAKIDELLFTDTKSDLCVTYIPHNIIHFIIEMMTDHISTKIELLAGGGIPTDLADFRYIGGIDIPYFITNQYNNSLFLFKETYLHPNAHPAAYAAGDGQMILSPTRENYYETGNFYNRHILPVIIEAQSKVSKEQLGVFGNCEAVKKFHNCFYNANGIVSYENKPKSYDKVKAIKKWWENHNHLCYRNTTALRHLEFVGQNLNVKVKKSLWSPYFWSSARDFYIKDGDSCVTEQLGWNIKNHTEKRKNYWNYVKEESGVIDRRNDYYYNHYYYEKNFKNELTKELMGY